jgi:ribosomal protein S27AE
VNAPQAHRKVAAAVAAGKLVRQPCEVCGATVAQAHHDDYDKPLEVRWLCKPCHWAHHYPPREPPVMIRADITRDELLALKVKALHQGFDTTQSYLGALIRADLAKEKKGAA